MRRWKRLTGVILFACGITLNPNSDIACCFAESVAGIVEATGVKGGLCVHLGVTDGKLTAALGKGSKFLVHGLAADATAVGKAREHITKQGFYGRVSIEYVSLGRLPYADSLANLLVVSEFAELQGKGLKLAEVVRVLAPNGVACLDGKVPVGGMGYNVLKSFGEWTLIEKPLPSGSDEWTHQNYDTSGNRVSKDVLAGPPQRLRWLAGVAWAMPDYKAKSMVIGGGRVYYVINESAIRKKSWPYLTVRDAFSGVLLWKRAGSPKPLTMIAAGKRFYMSSGEQDEKLVAVDSATGQLLETYEAVPNPQWALLHAGNLFVACGQSCELKCLDPETGMVLWSCPTKSIEPGGGLTNAAILDGMIYYTERRKGTIGCLDLATGTERWYRKVSEVSRREKGGQLCAVQPGTMVLYNSNGVQAFSTVDGKHLWNRTHEVLGSPTRRKAKSYSDGFFIDGLYWTHVGDLDPAVPEKYRYLRNRKYSWQGLEPATGKVKKTFPYPDGVKVGASCFPDQATARYFMGGYSDFMDVKTGKYQPRAVGLHTSCLIGLRAAYGLTYNSSLYMPGRFLQGDMAVESGEYEKATPPGDASRLEKGSAFGKTSGQPAAPGDWPVYRHDTLRTSRTSANLPTELKELWTVKVGAKPSAPTIAAGKVFIASAEEHTVQAMDAASGEQLWSYTAGGRVKVPPTYYRGLCLFGSSDGYAYCLDAATGKLVWRFRASRTPRLIVARGRVESTWPVDEGVTVHGGLAYFAAGRHGQVDGGIDLYALDCANGKLSWHKRLEGSYYPSLLAANDTTLALSPRERFGPTDGNKVAPLTIPTDAYNRQRIDASHVIGKDATVTVTLRALIKSGEAIFTAGQPEPRQTKVPRIFWQKLRWGNEIENAPKVHPLDKSQPVARDDRLWVFSAADGQKLSEMKLPSQSTWDGMAAAAGRLYLATEDGKLRCFAGKHSQLQSPN